MRVLIIADDLTGALDSAVTLTGAGLRCVVARRPGDVPAALAERPDVLSVSTASREGSAAAARAAVAAALDAVGALPEIVFKKVDSRLKGHVADEVAVLAARGGRSARAGRPGDPGAGPDRRGRPADRRRGRGADRRGGGGRRRAASTLEVPDTAADADFDAALGGALDGPPTLLVGAAGLAAALARRLAAGAWSIPAPRLRAPILLAIGSHDPITIAQVERLAATGDGDGHGGAGRGLPAAWRGRAQLVRLVAAEGRPFDPRAAGAALRRRDCATCQGGRRRDAARLRRRDGGRHPRRARAGSFDD